MKKLTILFRLMLITSLFYSCNNDEEIFSLNDLFYKNALTSSTNEQLAGKWSITQVKVDGKITDVPKSVEECGRDFFNFRKDGKYQEYLFDNSNCTPKTGMLDWTLSSGVITFTSGLETDQWVITELTSNRLVFNIRLDLDSDGELEVYSAICIRYQPPIEVYSGNFYWANTSEDNNLDKILLKWDAYKGYNDFEKYEVYRHISNCNGNDLELISTITNSNINSFIDETPPSKVEICYTLKIYTNAGLLETLSTSADSSSINVSAVNLKEPILTNSIIDFSWEKYSGYYFSHYEIVVRNYSSGSGGGYREEQLTVIDNIDTLNYSAELPYFSNPVFVIYVYNIFGKRNDYAIEGENQQSTNFKRATILPVNKINFLTISPDETILYYSNLSDLHRYNYSSNVVENSIELNSSSIVFIKAITSTFGTEIIVNKGGEIMVFDKNLNFKYNLNLENIFFNPDHLTVTENGFWLATDREKLYSLSRTDNNLNLINSNDLYNEHFHASTINILDLKQNSILVGNKTKSEGLIIDINKNGELSSTATSVNYSVISKWGNNLYSNDKKYIVNNTDNTVYDTDTNSLITTFNPDYFPASLNNDGSFILGTNNNSNSSDDYFHEKKVRTFAYPSFVEEIYETKGYPHFIFQNHLGQIISISKGLIGTLNYPSVENDIFIEVVK